MAIVARSFLLPVTLAAFLVGCFCLMGCEVKTVGRNDLDESELAISTAGPPFYELVDLTYDFADIYEGTINLSDREKVMVFRARAQLMFPGFYDDARVAWMNRDDYDRAILRALEEFPRRRGALELRGNNFRENIPESIAQFRAAFIDFEMIGPVFVLYSLGELDGGVREIGGKSYLVFGLDVMDSVHDFDDASPFIHHELFHVYRAQFFEECDEMWCALWSEGLAIAAAKHLTEEATDAQLLLTSPIPIRPIVDKNRSLAACTVLAVAESSEGSVYASLFGADVADDTLPPRFAYYVGLLVVEHLGRSRDLEELTGIPTSEAKPMVLSALREMGDCET